MLQHKAPHTTCRAPFHIMQSTLPRHAEHASTPCRTPFHIMQSMLPRHAEHASTPCRACFHTLQMPPHDIRQQGKACLQIRDMGSLSACKSPVGTRFGLCSMYESRPKHQKKGAPTSRRNTLSHIFNSPPLGRGWGWVFPLGRGWGWVFSLGGSGEVSPLPAGEGG